LPCRGERCFGIAERATDRAEIGESFDVIGLDGKRLLDQPCRRRMLAALMRDQPQMVEADKVSGLKGEDFGIGRLRFRKSPGPKIFERVGEQLRVHE
jgi:hypothetical protein